MAGEEFREEIRSLLYELRALPGEEFGLRPYRVFVREGMWSGNYVGRGAQADVDNEITEANGQPPKVRELSDEEIALGQLGSGSVEIGPITPSFIGGGTPLSTIQPAVSAHQTVHIKLVGPKHPNGALYRIVSVATDRVFRWMIKAEPVANAESIP